MSGIASPLPRRTTLLASDTSTQRGNLAQSAHERNVPQAAERMRKRVVAGAVAAGAG